jgi:RHS repeat-associated protein
VPPEAAPNTATWTLTVPTAGSYQAYARWTQHPNRATDAQYTVNHAGGATQVTVNQAAGGGNWSPLGSFTFNAGPTTITLTDQANGYVIADAVQLAPAGAAPNSATWSPNLSGPYELYAKWTDHVNRATNATYTVTHPGGATPVTVNQQAGGGQWNLLGTFNLTPSSNITLTDQANGYVVADAIQLISVGPAPQQMYFIHTDHLNTPRRIYNQAQQLVWSWDNTEPFGDSVPSENPSGLGVFVFDLRFPGQVWNKETQTAYNYQRDAYDPAIGGYIQPDRLGVMGQIRKNSEVARHQHFMAGRYDLATDESVVTDIRALSFMPEKRVPETNLYSYVGGKPLRFSDPTGEIIREAAIVITATAIGITLYATYDCARRCEGVCPIPQTGDPPNSRDRDAWILKCKIDCVKAFGGFLRKYTSPTPPIDPFIVK